MEKSMCTDTGPEKTITISDNLPAFYWPNEYTHYMDYLQQIADPSIFRLCFFDILDSRRNRTSN